MWFFNGPASLACATSDAADILLDIRSRRWIRRHPRLVSRPLPFAIGTRRAATSRLGAALAPAASRASPAAAALGPPPTPHWGGSPSPPLPGRGDSAAALVSSPAHLGGAPGAAHRPPPRPRGLRPLLLCAAAPQLDTGGTHPYSSRLPTRRPESCSGRRLCCPPMLRLVERRVGGKQRIPLLSAPLLLPSCSPPAPPLPPAPPTLPPAQPALLQLPWHPSTSPRSRLFPHLSLRRVRFTSVISSCSSGKSTRSCSQSPKAASPSWLWTGKRSARSRPSSCRARAPPSGRGGVSIPRAMSTLSILGCTRR